MNKPGPDLSHAACEARLKFNALTKVIADSGSKLTKTLEQVLPGLIAEGVEVTFAFNEKPVNVFDEPQASRYELRLKHAEYVYESYFYKDEGN